MARTAIDALHDIHTATNDVLKGYREMALRGEPDIQSVITRLTQTHERHAAQQAAELARSQSTGTDDESFQGTVNRVVVVLRDWASNLDRDVLPAVRDGETSLRDEYVKVLKGDLPSGSIATLLRSQLAAIDSEIAALPAN